ncbi:hypothetical protein BDQ12DRAFT_698277 [Crucibulum laeve]|uniref:Uncharacterized protein n=1 Tax=Crucibulum laeve TaxID=68775 RepID=A0A5C3M243_9AGAR|nr:hypothetical protein BDQ12DRAFT_698277 [Crucibulum laeve]
MQELFGTDLSASNHFGAPFPPWAHGAHPGWYFGHFPWLHNGLPCFPGPSCKIMQYFPWALQCPPHPPHFPFPPHHPPPPPPNDGYHQTFSNLTGATQAADYMTYGLVDTVADCKAMCDSVQGCKFVNSYHDVNGKDGSTQLTCSLFTNCHTSADADNKGGQTQPDGSIDFIQNSDGWCKV